MSPHSDTDLDPAAPLVVLTRPYDVASRFIADWHLQHANIPVTFICAPMLDYRAYPVPDLAAMIVDEKIDSLMFTSQYGVEAFKQPFLDLDHNIKSRITSIFCVGSQTKGMLSDFIDEAAIPIYDAQGDIRDLMALIVNERGLEVRLLCPAGLDIAAATNMAIDQSGLSVTHITVYEMMLGDDLGDALALLQEEREAIYPFFSPRSAAHFDRLVKDHNLQSKLSTSHCIAMSDAVAEQVYDLPWQSCFTIEHPRRADMMKALKKACVRLL